MKVAVEIAMLVIAVVGTCGGIWNRAAQGKGFGVRFIQYLGMTLLVPVIAILSLEGRMSVEMTGAVMAAAVGGVLATLGRDDAR